MKLEFGEWIFADMERKIQQYKIHTLLFCSPPHNPTGRVWSREELERLSDLCENMIFTLSVMRSGLISPHYSETATFRFKTVSLALRERTMAFLFSVKDLQFSRNCRWCIPYCL